MNPPARKFDMRLTRGNQIALGGLCILAWLGLTGAMAGTNQLWFTNHPPVDREKVRAASEKIDPNTASIASLRRLPGIGLVRAENIVIFRRSRGSKAFHTPEDLEKIHGIGKGTVHKISPYLKIPIGKK